MKERVEVSGVPVSCLSWEEILKVIDEGIRNGDRNKYISITNTESMFHALRDQNHLEYIKGADLSLCDGIGSVIGGLAWGHNIPRRNGPILVLKCCEYGVDKGWRHFFYGGKEGVAKQMVENLEKMYPGMITAGTYCPPFRDLNEEEGREIIEMIRDAKPDILWVGLGLLKQERWVSQHLSKIECPWMVGVGAAFDYHSGEVSWAPNWMQAIGMEWLYRLILQPKLRFWRYVWSFEFMFRSIWEGLCYRITKKKPR